MLPTPDEQARVVIELLAVLRREQKNKIRLRYRGTDADKYAQLEKCRKLERQFDALLKSIDPNTPTRYDEILSVALTMREWQVDTIKKKTRFNVRTTRAYENAIDHHLAKYFLDATEERVGVKQMTLTDTQNH